MRRVTVSRPDRGSIHIGMSVQEVALEGKMEQDSKKEKRTETNASKEASDYAGIVSDRVGDGYEVNKEAKRKQKYKTKAEVSSDVELDGSHSEKDYKVADENYQKEEKMKKKKRKFEAVGDNDNANEEIHMGGEERSCLQTDDGKDLGNESALKARKEKKRYKEDRKKDESDYVPYPMDILEVKEMDKDEVVKKQRSSQKDNTSKMKCVEEHIEKEKKKVRKDQEIGDFKGKKETRAVEGVEEVRENYSVDVSEKVVKKRKREKKRSKDDLGTGVREMMVEELHNESTVVANNGIGDDKDSTHSIRKKEKNGSKGNRNKQNSVGTDFENPKPKVKSKKVRFSGEVEVFPSSDGPSKGKEKNQVEKLVQGKRFSPEEDEMVKESVFNYIEDHDLGEEGLHMVLHCRSYPKVKNCWKEIGAVLPHRPYTSIYYRAHSLFERGEDRSWTTEELEIIQKHHEEHGAKWKELAYTLGKNRVHLKDTWRRIKLPNKKKGHWSQEEYQGLFDLVNMDLSMKAFEEKKTKHGMLRDNISWGAISDKLSTRIDANCCEKWYSQLTSPMVAEGDWANTDDYRLLIALFNLDACCIEDVDWDNLLDHRSGDVCRKRWNQMVKHIGKHGTKSFTEQVEILSRRYCPDILEVREAWDSKPAVS
ncbi:Cyclin-D-binding Myb-like transcription factor [Actinidia chinensis var. chinensis]|uniref:Cyclin-D-binding Myb-like transcription factor n=1 Tax=Actinidia chinensis var. chinensis TaxID=1590841 RepID=A0A2R6PY55_ACTCC|nr:Cyclin-D-binding Myb-like transcription factor [Actinidia chinensis var. chinensis]